MKNLSIILACLLVAMVSCTKSKEVHPEIGDGNDEIVTVGMKDVHMEYTRTDHAELSSVVFHYCPADANGNAQQFDAAEMTKKETFFDLVLDDLICDTLYWYYYELFPNSGNAFTTAQKTFHTQIIEQPGPPTPPVAELPTIVTIEISEITSNSAQCGGDVVNDGGEEVTERGICWGTNENPNLNDNHIAAGMGTGPFTAIMNGLEANTTYHVRAYATNEAGTAYGLDMKFTTLSNGGSDVPEGAINGLFTINENGDQVYFSQGNLQYQASTNTWRFAENQWDYVGTQIPEYGEPGGTVPGSDNANISQVYDGWIDLFGWGTSGYHDSSDPYNVNYQPWSTLWSIVNENYNYYGYGPSTNMSSPNLTGSSANYDWGIYNPISNGGNQTNQWRTLTHEEWEFVINSRPGIRYAKATVNNVKGVILLPDDWSSGTYSLSNTNSNDASFDNNTLTVSQWSTLEQHGAIFLPAAGDRVGTSVSFLWGGRGSYWSASYGDDDDYGTVYSYGVLFYETSFAANYWGRRDNGHSVRLVQDAR